MMYRMLLTALFAFLLPVLASAQSTRSQENRKARLEKEIAILDRQLKDNASKSSNALASLTLIRKKVADRKELVAESDKEITVLDEAMSARQKEADRLQQKIDTLSNYYAKLIKSAYRNRDSKVWYMYILASENLGQALRRVTYLKNLSGEMNRQGEVIMQTQAELQNELDSLAIMRSEAKKLRAARATEVSRLQKEEAQSADVVKQLQKNKTKYQKELAAKKRQVEALNKEIQRIIAASTGSKASSSSKNVDIKLDAEFAKNKGKLPWPGDGPVTEHFGKHPHPVIKTVMVSNEGINIAMEKDAAVRCVFDGVVKNIIVMPGYNKCVFVQHGNYFTFYCKLGTTSVKTGDKIKTGDIIGTVATMDGLSELHFQIWKGKTPQNPELWLR